MRRSSAPNFQLHQEVPIQMAQGGGEGKGARLWPADVSRRGVMAYNPGRGVGFRPRMIHVGAHPEAHRPVRARQGVELGALAHEHRVVRLSDAVEVRRRAHLDELGLHGRRQAPLQLEGHHSFNWRGGKKERVQLEKDEKETRREREGRKQVKRERKEGLGLIRDRSAVALPSLCGNRG